MVQNETGEYFMRTGRLSDKFKPPYPNDEFARSANNGALPPDLSLMKKSRPAEEDYIFALLTGYIDPPAGVSIRKGMYFNPYFVGGAIAMPPPLVADAVDYEDGTPASVSQMAKDVATFLCWCSEPEHDDRKKLGFKVISSLLAMTILSGYYKRFRWSSYKTRRLSYWDMEKSLK